MVDQSRSAVAARACRAQEGACFRNAFVALGAPAQPAQGLAYIEGWVYDPAFGFAYHHGWNEVVQDNQPCVVDATLYRLAGLCYFPVLRLTRAEAVALHEQIQRVRGKQRPTLPFVVYAHDLLPGGVTLRFRQARDMAEAWGQATPPHRALAAALSLLDAYPNLDGRDLILATHVLLEEAAIAHTPMRGSISRGPSGAVLTPHWWIDLADGKRIDFRARQGLDHESGIPSGIFDPAAWPDVAYQGAPVMDIPPVDATRGALDLNWLTLSAAVRAAVARPGGAETAR